MRMAGQQHPRFRALLPAAADQAAEAAGLEEDTQDARDTSSSRGGSPLGAGGPRGPPTRGHGRTLAACLRCRRSKAKCTGARPSCRRCSDNNHACEYDADPDITPSSMLRRRNVDLARENDDLRALIAFLSDRPLPEAEAVFRRLRQQQQQQEGAGQQQQQQQQPPPAHGSRADPLEILTSIRGAELLLGQGRPAARRDGDGDDDDASPEHHDEQPETAAEEGRQGGMAASHAADIAVRALSMVTRDAPQAESGSTEEGTKNTKE
ncbi:hypothetical protein GGTG_09142 [Gaeumannomyces tritici R3-111a-1]|uniref:Zn(2)-C6 fungal-type domain-containing protein n=1 Tax=Gaeumannomyces tritici (strain R3-111a-1) TaxID=644352 RepID=J3P6K1_GAET3|nr:hypothetical protein GGTG_09142 [Gaeumannomyces tritici R3-111a-1]EJT72276.1 hypothetical protein GGTG_09142 [Gaeumannomyces tritici R3-111a-1]